MNHNLVWNVVTEGVWCVICVLVYVYIYIYIHHLVVVYICICPQLGAISHIFSHIRPEFGAICTYIRPEFGAIPNSIVPNSGYMYYWQRFWNYPSSWVILTAIFWWKTQSQVLWKLPPWRLKPMSSNNIHFVDTWITSCTTIIKNTWILWNSKTRVSLSHV